MANPVPVQPAQTPAKAKDFDFQGFFTNEIVLGFITQLFQSFFSIFKSEVSKDVQQDLKQQATSMLQNLNKVMTPAFMEQLANGISNTIGSKLDKLIEALAANSAKPEELTTVIQQGMIQALPAENLSPAIEQAFQNIKIVGSFEFKAKNDGL